MFGKQPTLGPASQPTVRVRFHGYLLKLNGEGGVWAGRGGAAGRGKRQVKGVQVAVGASGAASFILP